MSVLVKGMEMPKHVAVNGEKDTAYKCVILAHPDEYSDNGWICTDCHNDEYHDQEIDDF